MSEYGRDGRSTRWDPHRRERRAAIVSAAVEAIETLGPDVLTGQIADVAGVPRTHVYRHFEGKGALDLAVSRRVGSQILAEIKAGLASGTDPRDVVSGGLSAYLRWIEAHPNLYRFLAKNAFTVDDTGEPRRDDAKNVLAAELTIVFGDYLRSVDLDDALAERTIIGLVGLVDNTAQWWLAGQSGPRAEIEDWLTRLVWMLIVTTLADLGHTLDPDAPAPA